MASPSIHSSTSGSTSSDNTSHSITLPASIAAGDLLIIVFQNFDDSITPSLAGWTQDLSRTYILIDPTLRVTQFSKVAAGGETSVSVTTSSATTANWIVYRVGDGAIGSVSTAAQGSGNSPDPADFGSPESFLDNAYLMTVAGWEADVSLSSYPSGYSVGQSTARVSGTDGSGVAAAMKLVSATEDAGSFGLSGSGIWLAYTQVIEYSASDLNAALNYGTLTLTGKDLTAGAINVDLESGMLSLTGGDTLSTVLDPTFLEAGSLSLFAATNLGCYRLPVNEIKKIDMNGALFDLCILPPLTMDEGDYFGCVLVGAGSRGVTIGFTAYPTPSALSSKGDSLVCRYINDEYYTYTSNS